MVQALPPKSTAIKICRSPQLQTLGAGRLLHNLFNGERDQGECVQPFDGRSPITVVG